MKNESLQDYYLGFDIGTDSVGYAAVSENYDLLKFKGKSAWGVTLFDAASPKADRRTNRTARRRLNRRQQRVRLVRELFAEEIAKKDESFYKRLQSSALWREDTEYTYPVFNEENYTDRDYYEKYPTIHHLIAELMNSNEPHDVRLVYIACAWLVAHRGHFLSNIDKNNIEEIKSFDNVYDEFKEYFSCSGFNMPWTETDSKELGDILKKKIGVKAKEKELKALLYGGKNPSKEATEDFPFSQKEIITLLAGGTAKLKDIFLNDEYADLGSISLGMDDDVLREKTADIGDDFELIEALRLLTDWAVLAEVFGNYSSISEAKVAVYKQHKKDLEFLKGSKESKGFIRKYLPGKYKEIFRTLDKNNANYSRYVYHTEEPISKDFKSASKDDFSKYILKIVSDVVPDDDDKENYDDMISRLESRTFLPKQKDTDNRVIPYQLYWYELNRILENASEYLPFLAEKDEDGLSVAEKIESVFLFRIPYFVGPLNKNSPYAWLERKAEKIYPWNFEKVVDLDKSEDNFIKNMTNTCTYLPGEYVLPKDSLLYHKYTVLNEINNLKINGEKIPVDLKQRIYNELFMNKKKVTKKALISFLEKEGFIEKGDEKAVEGIDININSNLVPNIAFKNLLSSGALTEADAEKIVLRATCTEDKLRFNKWLEREYPHLEEKDRKHISSQRFKDFGRLSRRLLSELEGVDKSTGEVVTVISALWNTQYNLMEIIASDENYTFKEVIEDEIRNYYSEHTQTIDSRLDEMYVSNSVKRPIYITLAIIKDIIKIYGKAPKKIFVETTREKGEKGKRTKTRKDQILELYQKCDSEEVRTLQKQLEDMGTAANTLLQSEKLFLYYMQLGRCLYSDEPISLSELATDKYNIEHIYPQAFVKDDSIINNKALVLSKINGDKSDEYPIKREIRNNMHGKWEYLKKAGLISEEKFKRLTRSAPFSEEEKYEFINRQLVETSQSAKAVATLLGEIYPETEIVYTKAANASEFRHEFDLYKSRTFNDLHHAVDAYINVVVGNVYSMQFNRRWFNVNSRYSRKIKTIFTHPVVCGGKTVWDGIPMLTKVKKIAAKNTAQMNAFSTFKTGGLFDQMPLSAAEGLVPRKKNLPTEKYGGYNKASVMFFIPVKYTEGKKTDVIIMSVELLHGKKFLADADFALEYTKSRLNHILGKEVRDVSFPLGMRPWKVNTMLSLDGFRVCISGSANKGQIIQVKPFMPFCASSEWCFYMKKLEELSKKADKNASYVYSEKYDKVSAERNVELYDLYIEKLSNTMYSKRPNSPVQTLISGRERFWKLDIVPQAKALLNIHQVFGRLAGGIDLAAVGGKSKAAAVYLNAKISAWKKAYTDVRIIDTSPSGLREKRSVNLLDLL